MQSSRPNRRNAAAKRAMAQTTGLRVLKAIGQAVPVRLMKRDMLFVVERLAAVLDERPARHWQANKHRRRPRPSCLRPFFASPTKAHSDACWLKWPFSKQRIRRTTSGKALREAADYYKVDVAAITTKVKQEFAAKGQGQDREEGCPQAARQGRQEGRSRVIVNNQKNCAEPETTGSAFLCPLPVFPTLICAPALAGCHFSPARRSRARRCTARLRF